MATIQELQKQVEDLAKKVKELEERRIHQSMYISGSVKARHIGEGPRFIRSGVNANLPETGESTNAESVPIYFDEDNLRLYAWDKTNEVWRYFVVVAATLPDYTVTNLSTDRAIDCDTAADAEISDVLGTLISDLQSIGVLQ